MDPITDNEIAGLGFGAFLIAAAVAAPKVDFFIAKYQRRQMKLCEECGGVKKLPCRKCRGQGQQKPLVIYPWASRGASCDACSGRGQLPCPTCSKLEKT